MKKGCKIKQLIGNNRLFHAISGIKSVFLNIDLVFHRLVAD